MDCSKKLKHLELIEKVIERMGKNSFQLKGWTVTLVSAIGAISLQGSDKRIIILAFIPLISFWLLDSYYLQIERKYTDLYEEVLLKTEDNINFSMDISTMASRNLKRLSYIDCFFSNTEILFYGLITLAFIVFVVIVFCFPVNSSILSTCNCCP